MDGGDRNGETWVKDMLSGEEYPLKSGGMGTVLGWLDDITVITNDSQTKSLNVRTGETKTIVDADYNPGLVKDQIVYQTALGSLTFLSLKDEEKSTVTSSLINRAASYQAHGSWLAIANQIKDGESRNNIVLYNIDTKVWKVIVAILLYLCRFRSESVGRWLQ